MSKRMLFLIFLSASGMAHAGDVKIEFAELRQYAGNWSASVTLKHADSGWDHYADDWRIVDSKGNVLGNRVLYHPHVDEQPFTRSLSGMTFPAGITTVFVEAHDKVHGWSPDRLQIDLGKDKGPRYRILR